MSDGHNEMFVAHAAEIEQARQYAESASREHDEAREALEALRAERAATIDSLDALAPEMTTAQLAGDDEAIASLHDTFKRLTARREQLAGELDEAETRLDTSTPGHLAYRRAKLRECDDDRSGKVARRNDPPDRKRVPRARRWRHAQTA
jgi:chromosome segregation ATPase